MTQFKGTGATVCQRMSGECPPKLTILTTEFSRIRIWIASHHYGGTVMRMPRARTSALRKMMMGSVSTCVLLAVGLGSAQAAVAAPAVTVPCRVSALVAAMGSASAGDTLSLASGCVYHLVQQPPIVSQDLTIDGNGSTLERSYDPGTPAFAILTVTGGAVTINDLEIRHGDNAITVSGRATITVNDSVFVNNSGTDGGAISSSTASDGPVVSGSVFINNKATGDGGAIYNNSSADGVTVTGSTFTDNIAGGDGGAIYDFCNISEHLTGSLVEGNRASDGGGIWFSPNAGMIFTHDTISHNYATGNGGGIAALEFNTLTLQDSTITSNRAADGGGLYVHVGNVETITGSEFLANTARDGGGIFSSIALISQTLAGSSLVDNKARVDGGGAYIDSAADPSGETWSASGSQIIGNVAGSAGGGIFTSEFATATVTTSQVRANKPNNCAPPGSVTGCTG